MRVRRTPAIAALLVVILAVVWALQARGPTVVTTVATRADLEQHLIASGRVRVVTRIQVSAQTPGRVLTVPVKEGQQVVPGQLLVQIDDSEAKAAVAQARAALAQAQARLDQIGKVTAVVSTEASRQSATQLARAEADLARATELAASGAIATADLDQARRAVEIARAQKTAADAERTAAGAGGVSSTIAVAAVAENRARLAAALTQLAQTRLTAAQDGVVLVRAVEPGDTVQPGTTLLEIVARGDTQLVIEPDERNLAWIRLGQQAQVSADAYPQEVFPAVVDYIAPAIDPQRGSIEVRLRVPDAPGFLRPGMTVSVDLTVAAKREVVTIPTEAIRDAAAAPWVAVVVDGRVHRQPITLGIRGEGATEVAAGLDAGTEVVVEAAGQFDDGQRVRTQRRAR